MKTDKTYVSPAFQPLAGQKIRIANKVIDGGEGFEFALVKGELILRETPAGRYQIKVTFIESSRDIQKVTELR